MFGLFFSNFSPIFCLLVLLFSGFGDFSIRHFSDPPGQEAREDLFETFWGFQGSGVWRHLSIWGGWGGIAIVMQIENVCSHSH